MLCLSSSFLTFFLFKQTTAYDMRISDWSSDVCSSDLAGATQALGQPQRGFRRQVDALDDAPEIARRIPARLQLDAAVRRSEERRVGEECVSTGRFRWATYHLNTKRESTTRRDEQT